MPPCAVRCMTIVFSRRPPIFVCSHEDGKSAVFETLNSGDRCRESAFLVPENGVYVCERKAKTEKKIYAFQNFRIEHNDRTCGQALMEYRVTEINAPLIRHLLY